MRDKFFQLACGDVNTMQYAIAALGSGDPREVQEFASARGLSLGLFEAHSLVADFNRGRESSYDQAA